MLEPFVGKSEYANHGQRVVEGQRLMQDASDIMLGWIHIKNGLDGQERDFYLRQLWDAKGSAIIETMEPNALLGYAKLCGRTLAKGHARSGDAIAIASYLGTSDVFDRAMAGVRRDLRRPERARLRRAQAGSRVGPGQGRDRPVTKRREESDGSSRDV